MRKTFPVTSAIVALLFGIVLNNDALLLAAPVNACGLNSSANEFGSSISPDGLTMYLESTRSGGNSHIFIATRPNLSSCFGTPTLLPNVNSGYSDIDPDISSDGLTLYFASTRASSGPFQQLFVASRPDTASSFGAPSAITELNGGGPFTFSTTMPSISSDGVTLYFASDRTGGSGSLDIWVSTRPNTSAPWNPPTNLSGVNSGSVDTEPEISADGLRLYFSSFRPNGQGGADIWVATRPDLSSPFGIPVNVTGVNSPSEEAKPNISATGDTLYFQSNRPNGLGGADIWVTSVPEPSTLLLLGSGLLALVGFGRKRAFWKA